MPILEVCAYSPLAAATAIGAGADRVELCRAPDSDGLTPTSDDLTSAADLLPYAPIHPIVRPRDSFEISAADLDQMLAAITEVRTLGYPGVVLGALRYGHIVEPDWRVLHVLMSACHGLEVTFHRAFDHVTQQAGCIGRLADLGVRRILTSGKPGPAVEHLSCLSSLVTAAANAGIGLMAGGGISSANVEELLAIDISEIHASAGGSQGAQNLSEVRNLAGLLARWPSGS